MLQDQADLLKAQQIYSTQSAMSSLGTAAETLAGGIVPAKLPETSSSTGDIQTLNLAEGDFSVTPGDFSIGSGGQGMLINPMMQFAVDPNKSPSLSTSQGIVASGPKVPGATTLSQYYQGLGQGLPSLQERSPLYKQAGLGNSYSGTYNQNTALLEYLQNQ